jgi:TatD DNase family protein
VILTDTHTHLYLNAFDDDRHEVVQRAIDQNIRYMLLPNIDSNSVHDMLNLCEAFPDHCFPMMGLHPTSVKDNYEAELSKIEAWFEKKKFIAVGEIGIDLYWDKSYLKQQEEAFRSQVEIALKKDLPIVIHSRDSFEIILNILTDYRASGLRGVFHCFTGTIEQAKKAINLGFFLGIGGVVTFKNSGLDKVVEHIDPDHLLLETDSPFLAPVPFRGKRNESAYIELITSKISTLKNMSKEVIANITTQNAIQLFNITTHE